jgi:FkbM family methyltransferase
MDALYVVIRRRLRNALAASRLLDSPLTRSLKKLEQRLKLSSFVALPESGVITCHGFELRYRRQDEGIVGDILRTGDYEPETRRAVESLLEHGMTFVDAGAHIGYYTMLAAKLVGPEGHVFSFEPAPGTRKLLCDNVERNGFVPRTTIESFAIADCRKTLTFNIDEQSSVSSRVVGSSETGAQLEATSLDEYFRNRAWPPVHLVKMDIEGAELAGLRGMRELVAQNATIAVIFEIHAQNLHDQSVTVPDLFGELQQMGFSRFSILRQGFGEVRVPDEVDFITEVSARTIFNILARKSA